uniref:Uncharacterized protein n=1 Tax=Phytophthora ramorum TaxID=164328 RepID=H3H4P4_PHYRM
MNDVISDEDMVKVILQSVAFEYRGVVRIFDKAVRGGNTPSLMARNTLRGEAELDKQRDVMNGKGTSKEPAEIMQVQKQESEEQDQHRQGGGKRSKQQKGAAKKKFKAQQQLKAQGGEKKSSSMALIRWSGSGCADDSTKPFIAMVRKAACETSVAAVKNSFFLGVD